MSFKIELTGTQADLFMQLIHERKTQDTRGTRNPLYIVKDKRTDYTIYDGTDGVIFADGELLQLENISEVEEYIGCKILDKVNINDPEDLLNLLKKHDDYTAYSILTKAYKYIDVAFFLTLKEAKNYMAYQSHNLYDPYVFVTSPGYGNMGLLEDLLQILPNLAVEEN